MNNKKIILLTFSLLITLTACTKKENKKAEPVTEKTSVGNVTITPETYEKIKIGLTYEEIKKIIGGDCNQKNETTYICSGEIAGTSATLTFENDKLKTKNQTGLE